MEIEVETIKHSHSDKVKRQKSKGKKDLASSSYQLFLECADCVSA